MIYNLVPSYNLAVISNSSVIMTFAFFLVSFSFCNGPYKVMQKLMKLFLQGIYY